nr:MAG TPA: hypothetical protein [Caudoviricetes sp.]
MAIEKFKNKRYILNRLYVLKPTYQLIILKGGANV